MKATIESQRETIRVQSENIRLLETRLAEEKTGRVELETQYRRLLEANAVVALQKGDVTRAKERIALMIREIDRCIQQLSERKEEPAE